MQLELLTKHQNNLIIFDRKYEKSLKKPFAKHYPIMLSTIAVYLRLKRDLDRICSVSDRARIELATCLRVED